MKFRWPDSRLTQFARSHGFTLALLVVFLYLVLRNVGLYPMVFADEWLYSSSARLQPFRDAILPSYLYLGVFRLTSSCGAGFLDCARIINALLLVGAAPFIYLIALRVCSRRIALLLALFSVLAPVSSFTAYFMPETAYFFGFFVFSWAALAMKTSSPLTYGLATGALLGMMSAVKVHALFLVPALLVFMVYLCRVRRPEGQRGWLSKALQMMLAALLALVLVKMTIGYAFAGQAGLSFLGNFYGTHANNSSSGLASLLALVPAALTSLKGHALALVLLMALPFATLGLYLADARVRADAGPPLRELQVYAVLMLGAALGMTVLFTASIASNGPNEVLRLHQRYYDFIYPLLLMIACAPLAGPERAVPVLKRALLALPLALLVWYAARLLPGAYSVVFTDTPELAVLTGLPHALRNLVWLTVLVLALWSFHRRIATQVFVFLVLPLTLYGADRQTREIQARSLYPSTYDKAGLMARNYLDREQTSRLVVAGEGAGLTRALFHIDNPKAAMYDLLPGAPFAREELTPHRDWVLVVGAHPLPADIVPEIKTAEYALIRARVDHVPLARIAFARPLDQGVLTGAEGLATPESWGAWSLGHAVTLRFAKPLPRALNILIKANTLPQAAGQQFALVVDGQRRPFRLIGTAQDRFFQFDTDGAQQTVTIEVPQPVTPRSFGYGNDDRLLGLALTSMEIGTRPLGGAAVGGQFRHSDTSSTVGTPYR